MDKHSNKVTFCKLSRFFRILFIDFSGLYSSKFPLEKNAKAPQIMQRIQFFLSKLFLTSLPSLL